MEAKPCYKCKGKAVFNYKSGIVTCAKCFDTFVMVKRFRTFLRTSLDIFGKKNRLLFSFDGSVNSLALAYMFGEMGQKNNNSKKMMFLESELVFIDASKLIKEVNKSDGKDDEQDADSVMDNAGKFEKLCKELNLVYEVVRIEDWIDMKTEIENMVSISTLGGYREDYLKILKGKVLKDYVVSKEHTKIVLPENAQQLASRSLKLLCKQRANEIHEECAFTYKKEHKEKELLFGRPLAEINDREILFFLQSKKLWDYQFNEEEALGCYNNKLKNLPSGGNLNILLADFVRDLQGEYVSTSSTMLRTIKKLDDLEYKKEGQKCKLCDHWFIRGEEDICIGCTDFKLNKKQ